MKLKKLLAMLLAAVMLFAVLSVPAGAATVEPKLTPKYTFTGRTSLAARENGEALVKGYDLLMENLRNFVTSIDFSQLDVKIPIDDFKYIQAAVIEDDPLNFWFSGQCALMSGDTVNVKTARAYYKMSKDTALPMIQQQNAAVKHMLKGITDDMPEYEREKIIHDRLVIRTEYDLSGTYHTTIYGALVEKKATCMGYSRAFKYLCNMAGIECGYATGVANGVSHMWNIVTINGNKYYCDVTWDDPNAEDAEGNPVELGVLHRPSYGYFNITTEQLLKTHTLDEGQNLPTVTATQDNYFVKSGSRLTEFDVEKIAELLNANGGFAELYFDNDEVAENIVDYIADHAYDIIDAMGVNYSVTFTYDKVGNEIVLAVTAEDTTALKGHTVGGSGTYHVDLVSEDGSFSQTVVTGLDYYFFDVPAGDYTLTIHDTDGAYVSKSITLGSEILEVCNMFVPDYGDVNCDGSFNLSDLLRLKLVAAGAITEYNGTVYGIDDGNLAEKLVEMQQELLQP